MFDFAETTKDMTAVEILNHYRNLYYTEPQVTERGIVANAINDILPRMSPRFVLCPKGWEGFARTRYYCPSCKKPTRDHEKFCHNCGQAVKYPKLAHSKTENKLFLDWSDCN